MAHPFVVYAPHSWKQNRERAGLEVVVLISVRRTTAALIGHRARCPAICVHWRGDTHGGWENTRHRCQDTAGRGASEGGVAKGFPSGPLSTTGPNWTTLSRAALNWLQDSVPGRWHRFPPATECDNKGRSSSSSRVEYSLFYQAQSTHSLAVCGVCFLGGD